VVVIWRWSLTQIWLYSKPIYSCSAKEHSVKRDGLA
jgi:hypothetical protein